MQSAISSYSPVAGELPEGPPDARGTRQAAGRLKPANAVSVPGYLALSLAHVGGLNGPDDVHDAAKDSGKEHGSSPE
jgi:hypothetical protein